MIDLAVTLSTVAISGTKKSENKNGFPLEYFVFTEGPLTINPHPFGSLGPHLTYKPHLYYKKSQEAGEHDIVRLNQRKNINEESWIHADGTWFEAGIHETKGTTEIDPNIFEYLLANLSRSTKSISFYHNHPYHHDESKPHLTSHFVSIAECPAYNDLEIAEERITEVRSRFPKTNVDYRVVTPSGVYILKLKNEEYYRTQPYHYAQNKRLIDELIYLKTDCPSGLRQILGLNKNASMAEENKAFCKYLNERQMAWEFSFVPIGF
ncbi:MAG: hypothetical protein V3T21_06385 [Candidatus Margulisiibacteriota bacterium]